MSAIDESTVCTMPPASVGGTHAECARRAWNSVARAWGESADAVDVHHAGVTARMVELVAPRPGERVLELACGAAGVGIAAARMVRPDGTVTVSDYAGDMVAIALDRARALGIENMSGQVLNLDDIAQPDSWYDVVLCRDGLMFARDPAHALREIRRVLRPGGRVSVAVHGPRQRNPWLGLPFDLVSAAVGRPLPPPGVPGPFALGDRDQLARLLADAGFNGVAVDDVAITVHEQSTETWWATIRACAAPLAAVLSNLPPPAMQALVGRLEDAAGAFRTGEGLELPGSSLVAAGARS